MRVARILVTIVLLAASAAAAGAPELPPTVQGRRMAAWLRAFNSGDRQTIRHFIEENYAASALKQRPADDRLETYMALYGDTRGFELRAVEAGAENAITVVAQAKSEEWFRITCKTEPGARGGIVGMIFRSVPRPPEFGAKGVMNSAEMTRELDRYLSKLTRAGLFSGVVAVRENGAVVYEKAFGKGDAGAFTTGSEFGLASIAKSFTAVAIAQLAQAGKLSFQDAISKYLPEYPRPRGDQITIDQLLTHMSGTEPFLEPKDFEELERAHRKPGFDLVRFLGERPLVSKPGTEFHYSNAGYWLLDIILQNISGKPLAEYLEGQVFRPAGIRKNLLAGCTAPDLLRFAEALRTAKLLSPEMTALVMSPKAASDDPEVQRAYGLQVESMNGVRIMGHPGGGPKVSAQMDIYPERGYAVVVLSSQPGGTAQRAANKLREMITQK